jgi:hypothetical protein
VAHGIELDHLTCPMVQCNLLMGLILVQYNLPMGQTSCPSCKDHGQDIEDNGIRIDHMIWPMDNCNLPMGQTYVCPSRTMGKAKWSMVLPMGQSLCQFCKDHGQGTKDQEIENDHLICPMVNCNLPMGQTICLSFKDPGQGKVAHGIVYDHLKCPTVQCNLPMVQTLCQSYQDHGIESDHL